MRRYSYVILTSAHEGREDEFRLWYDGQHLGDVKRIPGVVAARRFDVVMQKANDLDAPKWHALAIYEIEAEDPQTVLSAISAASGTEAMPLSPALKRQGMVQLLGTLCETSEGSEP
jgi:hypothetical protein